MRLHGVGLNEVMNASSRRDEQTLGLLHTAFLYVALTIYYASL
jgi:hypothetical protein